MDEEITGMYQLAKILDDLDEEARARLIRWAADKYGVDVGQPTEGEALDGSGRSTFLKVDPDELAAACAARVSAGRVAAPDAESRDASGAAPEEAPPRRDPGKPSFLDTSFRMYSGKKELEKAKDEKK